MHPDAETLESWGWLVERESPLEASVTRGGVVSRVTDAAASLLAALLREQAARPDDLRARGWSVAVHNDYRIAGKPHTFWLLTRGREFVKGEGRTDAEALESVRAQLSLPRLS